MGSTLGLDSIVYVRLAAVLKTEFSISISPHEFYQFSTFNDIATAIYKKVQTTISKNKTLKTLSDKNIGIFGISVLMPGNLEIEDYWKALIDKKHLIFVPHDNRKLPKDMLAGYLSDVNSFDYLFFSISALEASKMDPRQKNLLQIAWKTIEDAGFSKQELAQKKVGCYIAATGNDFASINTSSCITHNPYSLTGASISILANRISSYFDWRGPSVTIDTACSGSLVAVIQACNDLINGVCEFAFVGSANLILDKEVTSALKAGNFLSPSFRCATFDAKADGYVRAEGFCGIFLGCIDDNNFTDHNFIYGLIKSWALGHGGKANSLTAPNINGLTDLFLDAYTPELAKQVSYIETHGTGTKLGDPIEITSLKRAWEKLLGKDFNNDVYLGSVKTNIGHLEASAGLASLAKVLMAFKYRVLPANLHFEKLNDEIDLSQTAFKILKDQVKWDNVPRVAGVSSFGFGGTNAHIVVSEPVSKTLQPVGDSNCYCLIVVSARTERSLREYLKNLYNFLVEIKAEKNKYSLIDIAYTLSVGRTHFEYRIAWIVDSLDSLIDIIRCDHDFSFVTKSKILNHFNRCEKNHENLYAMRDAYLKGDFISWDDFYRSNGVKKMHLPTYVFD